jgi:hypothetical protein
MTHQEWTVLAVAMVLMVTNLTGAALAFKRLRKSSLTTSSSPRPEAAVVTHSRGPRETGRVSAAPGDPRS